MAKPRKAKMVVKSSAENAIRQIRTEVERVLSGLSAADYETVVEEIGADFDGRWQAVQDDRKARKYEE